MKNKGVAHLGVGAATGENRAEKAARKDRNLFGMDKLDLKANTNFDSNTNSKK